MPEKKRKKMTQRQKDERAAIKKRLQAQGLIPPGQEAAEPQEVCPGGARGV